jgi:predicted RNase H-like nuclease (RuvC/YqgF family)
MARTFLTFAQLRRDPLLQARVAMDPELVHEYTDAVLRGDRLPHVSVVFDRQFYYLVDGWHRCAALEAAGKGEVEAEVVQGTYRDAMLASFAANSRNGARRSNADKRLAVQRLLADKEWAQWSNEVIAKACVVSPHTVAEVRQSISANAEIVHVRTVERKGKTYPQNTAGIGRKTRARQPDRPAARTPVLPSPVKGQSANPDALEDQVHVAQQVRPETDALDEKLKQATRLADDRAEDIGKLTKRVEKLKEDLRKRDARIRTLETDLEAAQHENRTLLRGLQAAQCECEDVVFREHQSGGADPIFTGAAP